MGNQIDCCYSTRQYNQCLFPCIRTCSYSNRRVFYNFDGLESVQPLIDIYFPKKGTITKFPGGLDELREDEEIARALAKGKTHYATSQPNLICKGRSVSKGFLAAA